MDRDEEIYNLLKDDPDLADTLDEQELDSMTAAVERHKARIAAPQGAPSQGPSASPSDDYLRAKSIVEQADRPPMQTAQQSLAMAGEDWKKRQETGTLGQGTDPEDWRHKVAAFSANVIPGYTMLAQGAEKLSGALGLKSMTPGEVQQEIARAAEANPVSGMLGGVAQGAFLAPAGGMNAIAKGARLLPAMKTGAGLAGTQYLTQKMNVAPEATAPEVLTELPVHMTVGALGGGAAEKFIPTSNPLVAPVAKRAAKGVRDWADTYARQTMGIDPDTIMRLEQTPSVRGLTNRYEDILEELATNVIPGGPVSAGLASPMDIRQAAIRNLDQGEMAVDYARAPMRIPVKGEDLSKAMEEGALGLERRNTVGGSEAADILRKESASLIRKEPPQEPSLLVQAQRAPHQWTLPPDPVSPPIEPRPNWESEVDLRNLEKLATSIRAPEYRGALKANNPEQATRLAAEQLQSIQAHEAARQAGLDPMELMAQSSKANELYEAKRKAAEIAFGVEGATSLPPSMGYVSSAPIATQAGRGVLSAVKDRGARSILGASKKALRWATNKLNEGLERTGPLLGGTEPVPRTGRFPESQALTQTSSFNANLSPFQLEAFKRQVDTLSQMDPGDFSVALYAMSTTDPVFNALWKKSQEDEGDGIMQAETNRTDQ